MKRKKERRETTSCRAAMPWWVCAWVLVAVSGCSSNLQNARNQSLTHSKQVQAEEVTEEPGVSVVRRSNQLRSSPEVKHHPPKTEVRWMRIEKKDRITAGEYQELRQTDIKQLERTPRRVTTARQGFVLPYPITTENVISTFGDCRPGGRTHAGLDIAGVGDHKGLGTPIYSMARAEVTFLGRPQDSPQKFGRSDKRRGKTERGPQDARLPRSQDVGEYGPVFYFTRSPGSWRSGTIIYTKVLEGPLEGYTIRYMHLGAIHPELERGSFVEAGQEIGLMGGTAVQHDSPHVHIDIEDEDGSRVDVAPFLGLPPDPTRCRK